MFRFRELRALGLHRKFVTLCCHSKRFSLVTEGEAVFVPVQGSVSNALVGLERDLRQLWLPTLPPSTARSARD